jgi:competence protein ComEA
MNDWVERNRGHLIVLLLSLILNGGLILFLHRLPPAAIQVVPPPATVTPGTVRVFVSGAVALPDVYELPARSLVRDAIRAAGGSTADTDWDQINLAREVKDQEHIIVPALKQAGPVGSELQAPQVTSGLINLNTATAAELEALPGIGPGLAQRIIEYRTQHGPFPSLEDVQKVQGIGPKIYETLKDRITVN